MVRVAEIAVMPGAPVAPHRMMNLGIALVLGLVIGVFSTFGVEYFISKHFSINIQTRFIKYHYYWIDLTTDYYYNTKKVNYKTGYHVLDMYKNMPSLFIRFYF